MVRECSDYAPAIAVDQLNMFARNSLSFKYYRSFRGLYRQNSGNTHCSST